MKKSTFVLILASFFLFISCSSNSPKGIVTKYFKSVQAGKYTEAIKCFSFAAEADEEQIQEFAAKLETQQQKEGAALKSFKILEEVIDKETGKGVVKVLVTNSEGIEEEQEIPVVNVDGKWMLEFGK